MDFKRLRDILDNKDQRLESIEQPMSQQSPVQPQNPGLSFDDNEVRKQVESFGEGLQHFDRLRKQNEADKEQEDLLKQRQSELSPDLQKRALLQLAQTTPEEVQKNVDEGLSVMGSVGGGAKRSVDTLRRLTHRIAPDKGLTRIGDMLVPAENAAQAMKIREALVKTGQIGKDASIQLGDTGLIKLRKMLQGK